MQDIFCLPNEIIEQCLSFLDATSLCIARRLCRQLDTCYLNHESALLRSCFLSYDKAFILEGLRAASSCRVAKNPSRALIFYDAACSAELGWASAFVDEGLPLAESLIASGHAYNGKALLERLHNSNTTLHAIKIDSMLLQIYRSTKSPTDALVENFYIKIRTHSDKCQETNCKHRDEAWFAEYKKTAKTILQEQNSYRNAVLRYAFAHPNRASPRDPWADL